MVTSVETDRKQVVPSVRHVAVRLALVVLRLYFRHFPISRGKGAVWNQVVRRHFLQRPLKLRTTSVFGAQFSVGLRDVLQSYLYFFGIWEPVITRYLLDGLSEGDIFIDVGANIGYYTLLASRQVGNSGRVFAVEAASGTYSELLQNLSLNRVTNVKTFHVAVSDVQGEVAVWLNRQGELAGATTLAHVAARRVSMEATERVEAKPLQQVIDEETICKARFIKIDVEGAEWAVVKSLGELLKHVSPRTEFLIEVNPALVGLAGGTVDGLLSCFAAAGFEPFLIANRYDPRFLARKVRQVRLRRVEGSLQQRQFDLILRRPARQP
jgi:FkbM family methyltransferase